MGGRKAYTVADKRLRPFFSYFGAKWRLAPKYPAPRFDTIVEPFAGSAQYACLYPDRNVYLCDKDPIIAGLWRYLIRTPEREILEMPDIHAGQCVDDLRLPCQEAKWLVGFWLQGATAAPANVPSTWMLGAARNRMEGAFWGTRVRQMIASQLHAIRHWRCANRSFDEIPMADVTWFVDPPYQIQGKSYMCKSADIDFAYLGTWCQSLPGQVIVCENAGAAWLPFRDFATLSHARGKVKPSKEVVWLSDEHR